MDYLSIEFLGILINTTGICLWAVTMLYLIRNKDKGIPVFSGKGRRDNEKSFDEEVLSQIAKQESARSYARKVDSIKSEQQLLWEFMEQGEIKKAKRILLGKHDNKVKRIHEQKTKRPSHRKGKVGDKYREVVKLADLGLTTNKISGIVDIPKGEIELLVKLRKKKREVSGIKPVKVNAF